MQIQVATILAGTETPTGDGITGAIRCVLQLPDRSKRAGVVKRGPIGQVAAEAFCAVLLKAWGLPVPDPFLIDENGSLAFASADVGYPNLKQVLDLQGLPEGAVRDAAMRVAMQLACSLPSASLAAACDEAIDNRDRNLGNILWDGATEAWIDHAMAIGEGTHMADYNKLCLMSIEIGTHDKMQKGAIAQGLLLERDAPNQAQSYLQATDLPVSDSAEFVAARLTSIGNRLVARFPQPIDLFSQPEA